jgi:hypothetical protein
MSIISNWMGEINKCRDELESLKPATPEDGRATRERRDQLFCRISARTKNLMDSGKGYVYTVSGKIFIGTIESPFKIELLIAFSIPLPELQMLVELKLKSKLQNIKEIWFETIDRRELGAISIGNLPPRKLTQD